MAVGTIRYWAAAREAAGTEAEEIDGATLAEVLADAHERHADRPRFAEVLVVCSLVLDGRPVGRRAPAELTLADGWELEVLPPFAGG
jgi:molybdopterin synthase sulfur carrier subunit